MARSRTSRTARIQGRPFLFRLNGVREIHHAAQREQAIGPGGCELEFFLKTLRQTRDFLEESLVDDRLCRPTRQFGSASASPGNCRAKSASGRIWRIAGSRRSVPGGSLSRISADLPFTDFSSQAIAVASFSPAAREKPVML